MPVHIPLHIGNIGIVQHICNAFYDIIPNLRLCQIQQQFIAAGEGFKIVPQCPVRMGTI